MPVFLMEAVPGKLQATQLSMPAMLLHSSLLPLLDQATVAVAAMGAEGNILAAPVALTVRYMLMVPSQTGVYYNFLRRYSVHELFYHPKGYLPHHLSQMRT